ncbi:hypothetical protein M409DRAFT_70011 [Zasmidium cellare ATCC 36951]|uniref:Helicase ATP-binding domain-containing protein n=1 Tax=Zasmidium cellare ATCC 36951 TaxID=1080233 RepID=A0A6A6C2L9_ZASCE|nr:uncharacterized protein M409DRAFT_70011 [Zasmidium cellare ATCC 36951]KAF2161183.1 hypothetical protein M409DRAFT_70011 [Zasmidium cellare ATCC 36951]
MQRLAPPSVRLRDYQEDSINAILKYLDKGEKRLGLSLATGAGKTVIFTHLIDRVAAPTQDATQTLILAHRRELVEQAARHCRNTYPEKSVEIEMAKSQATGLADITVASVQTLQRPDRLMRFDPDRFKLVLVDEAHHIVADSYMNVLHHFKLDSSGEKGPAALVGVSATFSRHDGLRLGLAIDHIVYHKDYVDMIDDKWLANAVFTTVSTGVNLSKVKVSQGDFQTGSLSEAVNHEQTNLLTVRAWLEKAKNRRSTLVFCVDLAHVASLTAMFRQHGVDARYVTSDTPTKERADLLEAFKAGHYPVLLNCGIFTEGTDIPNIDCVILARPTQSRNLLIQMIGRGLRLHPGKENCHVIDMVSSLDAGITTTPTLFGLDPAEILKETDAKQMKSLRQRREYEQVGSATVEGQPPELKGSITFTDYDDVNDLIQDHEGERHVRALSPHSWVVVDDGRWVLSDRTGACLTIKQEADKYLTTHTARMPAGSTSKSPYARPRQVGQAVTFEDALHGADTFAGKVFQHAYISKSAHWRRQAATDAQCEYLNKFRDEDSQLDPLSIRKGGAADLITKMKHGARGRFKRMAGEKKKAVRKQEKVDEWKRRQNEAEVKVGPVGV